MSETIKFTLSKEKYDELAEKANKEKLTIQDYVRRILFPDYYNTITPLEAVNKALTKYEKGERFTVPDIFGEEWNLPNGVAGQFGKKFFELVEAEYSTKIRFTGDYSNKRKNAVYEIL